MKYEKNQVPIDVWEPKYSTRKALVACYKVKPGINAIIFSRSKSMSGIYYFDGDNVINGIDPIFNGKIFIYEIPLDWLYTRETDSSDILADQMTLGGFA